MLSRQSGRTGLIAASEKGHEAVVRLLIEHKARVNAADQVHLVSNKNWMLEAKMI